MGFAEKKVELFRIVADADEEMTGKLIEFALQLSRRSERFTQEELAEFEKRSEAFDKNPETGALIEDTIARLRSKLIK